MYYERSPYFDYIFSAGIVIENVIYFFSEKENTFMKIEINKWKIEYNDKFIKYELNTLGKTDLLRRIGKVIYRLPLKGGYIDSFSLDNGLYKKTQIKLYDRDWDNFAAFEVNERFLYVFPKWEKTVFKIDSLNYNMEIISLMPEYEGREKNEGFTCFSVSCREDNLLWLLEEGNHQIYIYDMDNDTFFTRTAPEQIDRCTFFLKISKFVYCMTPYNKIFVWDTKTDKCRQLWEAEEYRDTEYYFGQMIFAAGKIIVLPALGDDIVIIDCNSGTSLLYDNYPEDFSYLNIKWGKYINSFEDNMYYYFPMRLSEYLMAIDKKTGEIIWHKVMMPTKNEKKRHMMTILKFQSGVLYENQEKIDTFFDMLDIKEENINSGSRFGEMIWRKVKQQ